MAGQRLEERSEQFRKAMAERDRRIEEMKKNQATVEGREERIKQQREDRERIAAVEREAIDIADDYGPRHAAERRRKERREERG
jgi:hypothetical protein